MADQVALLSDVINKGIQWCNARALLRRVSDSKKATPDQVKAATKKAFEAANALEAAFLKLMRAAPDTMQTARKTTSKPIDWGKIAGIVSKGAGALEDALNATRTRPITEVIDTEGESA